MCRDAAVRPALAKRAIASARLHGITRCPGRGWCWRLCDAARGRRGRLLRRPGPWCRAGLRGADRHAGRAAGGAAGRQRGGGRAGAVRHGRRGGAGQRRRHVPFGRSIPVTGRGPSRSGTGRRRGRGGGPGPRLRGAGLRGAAARGGARPARSVGAPRPPAGTVRAAGRGVPGGQAPARGRGDRTGVRPAAGRRGRGGAGHRRADGRPGRLGRKVACADAAYRAARAALQVHGAIGYTAEHDLSRFLLQVRALVPAWGTAAEHRARILAELR